MNARQKAKKYKRMYDELLRQPVKYTVEQHKIDTVRFERRLPESLVTLGNSDYLRHCIVKDIANGLAEHLDKYITCYTEFCPHTNDYRICGEIKVVERK